MSDVVHSAITAAKMLASQHPGIEVRVRKGTWHFLAVFTTTDGRRRRYAGKNFERALSLRAELVAQFAKGNRAQQSDTKYP